MFAKPKVSRGEVLLSIFLGVSASLISLLLLWNGIGLIGEEESIIPVSDVAPNEKIFYATQHGKFSTMEAAATFQKQHPTLNKSVVIEANDSFYIWSKLHVSKQAEQTVPTSFSKPVQLIANSCSEPNIAAIPNLLQNDQALKNNFEASQVPADWGQTITAISALTSDLSELRLLLLEHYRNKQTCLNLKFD